MNRLLIFILCCIALPSIAMTAPADSIGVEKKDGKTYILHKVDAKETLFSISRKYKASVNDIKSANPDAAAGLSIGQVIRIPYAASSTSEKQGSGVGKTHTVAPKETLFSISRKYKVSVEALNEANPSLASGLKIGQELAIPTKDGKSEKINTKEIETSKVVVKSDKKEEDQPAVVVENLEEQEVEASVKKTKSVLTPAPSSGYKKINESGAADLMENNTDNLKYLALHKTAPVGTIIQVRNDDNDQKIFVRVVGKMVAANNEKSILKLSPKAMERLGSKGEKITVSISYIP